MNKWFFYIILLVYSFYTNAQTAPQPSPMASWTQTVGITKISVQYSRPAVRGRNIFGGLLPYQTFWRTGANDPTLFYTSNDIEIEGKLLPAGEYAILSLPDKNTWKIFFTTDLDATEQTFDLEYVSLEVSGKVKIGTFTESFTIDISDISYDQALLNFYWDKIHVPLKIRVFNQESIAEAIEQKSLEMAGSFLQAAEYLVNQNMDAELAEEYTDKSIALKETFRNCWLKSILLRKKKQYGDALNYAYRAQELGQEDPVYSFFKEAVENAIVELTLLSPQEKK